MDDCEKETEMLFFSHMTMKMLEKQIHGMERQLHTMRRRRARLGVKETAILPSLAGALKGRLPKNAVAWQRKIRAEWDR